MIRIHRGSEEESCPELAEVRESELERVRVEIAKGVRLNRKVLKTEYKVARPALATAHHLKCCYCEQRQQREEFTHVEHYRPKSIYWWLTWTWDNLLFSCEQCNTSKRADFPLAAGSISLAVGGQPPGHESPLLIDPAQEDPREHLQFIPSAGFWYPRPRGASERGQQTIRALGWSDEDEPFVKPGLLQSWKDRAADLRGVTAEIKSAITTHDREHIQDVWSRKTFRFRLARAEFVALSLDVLDRSFPDHVRQRWDLSLEVIHDY